MLNQDETLILDDNKKYSVAFSTMFNSENYVFLIDQDDYTNTIFCKYNNEKSLTEVTDSSIIEELLKLFSQTRNS